MTRTMNRALTFPLGLFLRGLVRVYQLAISPLLLSSCRFEPSCSEYAKILSVGLSRKVRANTEIRAMIPELSVVAPAIGGLPVAYGVCEALRARQVYWAERENDNEPLHFRQYLEVQRGEKVLLVDDILRTGQKLAEVKKLVEERGGEVVGLAVVVYQPNPNCLDFGVLPFYYLAQLDGKYYANAPACDLCKRGVAFDKVHL